MESQRKGESVPEIRHQPQPPIAPLPRQSPDRHIGLIVSRGVVDPD